MANSRVRVLREKSGGCELFCEYCRYKQINIWKNKHTELSIGFLLGVYLSFIPLCDTDFLLL